LLKKAPSTAGFRCNLGITHFNAGRIDDAIATFKQVLEIDPHFNEASDYLKFAIETKENLQ
jgi:tetratricopeptide (TPR) repeat protein